MFSILLFELSLSESLIRLCVHFWRRHTALLDPVKRLREATYCFLASGYLMPILCVMRSLLARREHLSAKKTICCENWDSSTGTFTKNINKENVAPECFAGKQDVLCRVFLLPCQARLRQDRS